MKSYSKYIGDWRRTVIFCPQKRNLVTLTYFNFLCFNVQRLYSDFINFFSDEPTGRLALVFELMDMNMYDAIKGKRHYLPENRVKYYMYQLLKSIDHMHRNGIFHRDIKPENILLMEDHVKLADFGSCRGIYSK